LPCRATASLHTYYTGPAGGKPIGWVSLAAELQRDWARDETAEGVVEIVLTERLLRA